QRVVGLDDAVGLEEGRRVVGAAGVVEDLALVERFRLYIHQLVVGPRRVRDLVRGGVLRDRIVRDRIDRNDRGRNVVTALSHADAAAGRHAAIAARLEIEKLLLRGAVSRADDRYLWVGRRIHVGLRRRGRVRLRFDHRAVGVLDAGAG